ncbi:hypothetical protein ACKWTF_001767 [Chironomus riparius]
MAPLSNLSLGPYNKMTHPKKFKSSIKNIQQLYRLRHLILVKAYTDLNLYIVFAKDDLNELNDRVIRQSTNQNQIEFAKKKRNKEEYSLSPYVCFPHSSWFIVVADFFKFLHSQNIILSLSQENERNSQEKKAIGTLHNLTIHSFIYTFVHSINVIRRCHREWQ